MHYKPFGDLWIEAGMNGAKRFIDRCDRELALLPKGSAEHDQLIQARREAQHRFRLLEAMGRLPEHRRSYEAAYDEL